MIKHNSNTLFRGHSMINGMIKDENLNKMWKDYLVSGMEFRVKLMGLNNMVVKD